MQRHHLVTLLALAGFAFAAGPAAAQTTPPPAAPASSQMTNPIPAQPQDAASAQTHLMGVHNMQCTVTSVDKQTGIVEVTSHDMSLRLHFPPPALANVNEGDTITVHLSFSK